MSKDMVVRLGVALPMAAALLCTTALTARANGDVKSIGEVTAVIAEASAASEDSQMVDGQSGDTDFPFMGNVKAIATVGEVDAETGMALTGYPDGHSAWLADEDTVRVAYQSESYATMSNETYPQEMTSGATFTGSHVHVIDYDRAAFADFLNNRSAASEMVEGSGHLYSTIYNVFGDEVLPKSEGGVWGNQSMPDGSMVDYAPKMQLSEADFFVNSFCGSYYEPANKYGDGIGFADDVYLMAEEWNIQEMFDITNDAGEKTGSAVDTHDTMGLASIVVDIANETAYTVPALGQSGYEKILPINPGHPDYTVLVLAGYNHDIEPAPLKIYVGMKGMDSDGQPLAEDAPARDQFLARNGLLFGKIYGLALANETFAELGIDEIDTSAKMMEAYLTNADAPDTFAAAFAPTSYQWGGWDAPVSVRDTDVFKWQMAEEQPAGHTFFVGDSKTEHAAVDPDVTRQRWVQNMTHEGGMLAIELTNFAEAVADGGLPEVLSADVTRIVPAVDGALTLEVGDKGVRPDGGSHAVWEDGRAKTVAPDGLMWVQSADASVLIVDEDSGNDFGERKFALPVDPATMQPVVDATAYYLAMAGGSENPRAANGVAAYPGTFSSATSAEFSGTWPVTHLVARKEDGSFYTMEELAGTPRCAPGHRESR
jgi:hypothetical protein